MLRSQSTGLRRPSDHARRNAFAGRDYKAAAVAPLTVDFVRSPDKNGPDGKGRYLIAVNSGFGLQFNAETNHGQQSLAGLI